MKKQLLAASFLSAAIAAQAGSNTFGILFCSARVNANPEAELAVELPATPGYFDSDGNPVAVWKVGTVAAGGAIDTFYSENGPGAFQVRNTGNRNAFIYITTGAVPLQLDSSGLAAGTPGGDSSVALSSGHDTFYYTETMSELFGDDNLAYAFPDPSKRELRLGCYSLAVSTDVTGKVPVWRNLEWEYAGGTYTDTDGQGDSVTGTLSTWINRRGSVGNSPSILGQYLGYLAAGEVQPFDLKFYAPFGSTGSTYYDYLFIVRLEASTFRRWDHDK